MNKFNDTYNKIIFESRFLLRDLKPIHRRKPTIDEVKEELLNKFKFSSWEEFINFQSLGQCNFIAKTVSRLFPKVEMISAKIVFSNDAIKTLNEMNDIGETYAIHYLNKCGKEYWDFGKGTNRYNGVYGFLGLGNLYDIILTKEEEKQLSEIHKENPKDIGFSLRLD